MTKQTTPPPYKRSKRLRIIKPLLALALVAAMMIGFSAPSYACLDQWVWDIHIKRTTDFVGDDGNTYTLRTYTALAPKRYGYQIKEKSSNDFFELVIYDTKIVVNTYKWIGIWFIGWHNTNSETINFSSSSILQALGGNAGFELPAIDKGNADEFTEIVSQAVSYGTKIATKIDKWGEYWYRRGSDTTTAEEYLQAGLYTSSKDINVDRLATDRQKNNCDDYWKAINTCNDKYNMAVGSLGPDSALIALLIIASCIAFPAAAIVAIALAAFGGAGATWYLLVDSFRAYQSAESLYGIIKNY